MSECTFEYYVWHVRKYTHLQQKKATNWGQIQADFYWDTLTAVNIKKNVIRNFIIIIIIIVKISEQFNSKYCESGNGFGKNVL